MAVTTVADCLTLSLKRINIVQAGGTANAADLIDAFDLLNIWIDSLSIERLMVPFVKRSVFTISSTKGTPTNPYTVGAGGDINIVKPAYIDNLTYINNAVTPAYESLPLPRFTSDQYAAIPIKTLTSTYPAGWYYQPTYAGGLGSLYFYLIPTSSSLQGVLYAPSAIAEFGATADNLIVPAGYKLFLVDGLAAFMLASTFRENLPVDPQLMRSAERAKANIQTLNVPMLDMGFDPAVSSLSGSSVRANIYTGEPS